MCRFVKFLSAFVLLTSIPRAAFPVLNDWEIDHHACAIQDIANQLTDLEFMKNGVPHELVGEYMPDEIFTLDSKYRAYSKNDLYMLSSSSYITGLSASKTNPPRLPQVAYSFKNYLEHIIKNLHNPQNVTISEVLDYLELLANEKIHKLPN